MAIVHPEPAPVIAAVLRDHETTRRIAAPFLGPHDAIKRTRIAAVAIEPETDAIDSRVLEPGVNVGSAA